MEADPGVTTTDLLSGTDGPHQAAAEDFLHGLICEDCWAEPATADPGEHLGPACHARL